MRIVRIVASAAVAVGMVAVAAPAAQAKPLPAINIHVAAQATAGQPFRYTYSHGAVPKGDKVLIQRQVGATGWKAVAVVPAKSGAGKVPGLQMGKYWVRIVLVDRHGKGLKAVKRLTKVYGDITVATACGTRDNKIFFHGSCQSGSDVALGHTFDYAFAGHANSDFDDLIAATATSCRSFNLTFVSPDNLFAEYPAGVVSLSLVQSKTDAVTASYGAGADAVMQAPLDGGSFDLQASAPGFSLWPIDVNGTFSCYTATGSS